MSGIDFTRGCDGFCVFGASGHGLAVASFLEQAFGPLGLGPLVAFVDDERGGCGETLVGRPIVSFEAWRTRWRHLCCFVGVGSPRGRRVVADRLAGAGARFDRLYARHATPLYPHVEIAEGAMVGWNVYLGPLTTIGRHVQILSNASVGHDVAVGAYATICPGCAVSGSVEIGEEVFLGAGVVVVNGRRGRPLRIGRGAMLAAGAVVTKDVPEGASWSGNPARPLRDLAQRSLHREPASAP